MVCSSQLVPQIRGWARELGFSQIGVAGVDLSEAEPGLMQWLAQGFHGEMHYMEAHGLKRARPAELVPGTVSVITARMDYLPRDTAPEWQAVELGRLARPQEAVVSVYARGRDYHKVLRARLQSSATASPRRWVPSATACSPTRLRCWRRSSRAAAARAGGASIRWCSRARRAPCSSSARSTWTWRWSPPRPSVRTAAAARPAWTCARRRPSWRRTAWTRGAASRT